MLAPTQLCNLLCYDTLMALSQSCYLNLETHGHYNYIFLINQPDTFPVLFDIVRESPPLPAWHELLSVHESIFALCSQSSMDGKTFWTCNYDILYPSW